MPNVDRCHDAIILVAAVDVRADASVEDVVLQPVVRFLGIRLSGPAEVGKLGSVNAGDADMYLFVGLGLLKQALWRRFRAHILQSLLPNPPAS